MIYKRFTEKSAEEWRQIYKALQLMEFLVKNGSERVIDDARSHLSLLKMLRQFHYIDQNGKDQGINVRNRSKELTDLLSDVDKIRAERKKARATRNKYQGVEGGAGLGMGGSSSSSRYGGFGSETGGYGGTFGGSTRGVYGDGGGFGGESHDDYDEGGRRGGQERFEEYDEFDDGGATATPSGRRPNASTSAGRSAPKKAEPPKPKEPEVDLFDFGDEPSQPVAPPAAPFNGSTSSAQPADDDDFGGFESAVPASIPAPFAPQPSIPAPNYSSLTSPTSTATTTSSTQFAQPTPQPGAQKADFSNLFSTVSLPPSGTATPASTLSAFASPPPQQAKPSGYQPTGPNYFTSVSVPQTSSAPVSGAATPAASIGGTSNATAKKPAAGGDAFASLLAGTKKSSTPTPKGLTIADMAKQKSQAGLYGANAPTNPNTAPSTGKSSSGLGDLLG
jgi:epsin